MKLEVNLYTRLDYQTRNERSTFTLQLSPPDQAGVLHTGAAHGPLAQGGAVGDGPQRLPGHVRPLRGGEHCPGVTISDQTVNKVWHLLRLCCGGGQNESHLEESVE